MGCDIHMYVEYKKSVNNNMVWVNGDYFKHNPYYKSNDEEKRFERMELHGWRNYILFATLAGVRDYTEKVIPVSEPKGVPDDSSDYVKQANEDWDGDGHTHSWLTLKELKDYQVSNPTLYHTGLLSPKDLVEFDKNGTQPQSWCQGTNQEGYERREWSEPNDTLQPLIEKLQARAKELLQNDWDENYNPQNDEKVRIVFWFGN